MRRTAPPVDGTHWLNTDPVGPDVWRGRTTVLAFWTSGCESSRSLLHRLERLHHKMGGELVIVAVHSPRFADERNIDGLRTVVERLGLTIPVVHDPKLTTWGRYSPPGWPSVVLIDHQRKVVASGAGVDTSVLAEAIEQTCGIAATKRAASAARKRGPAEPLPIPAVLPTLAEATHDQLSYPSGLAVLPTSDDSPRLIAVADSGNSRVLLLDLDTTSGEAEVIHEIGGFSRPARVCWIDHETLAVSEPDHGRVVGVDVPTQQTWTISRDLTRPIGLMIDLDGSLVVADAGADKLIRIIDVAPGDEPVPAEANDSQQTQGVIAGTGATGCDDGPAGEATLAQPIDLVRSGRGIAFIDLASSALRVLTDKGKVLTSSDASFRESGLVDGPLSKAMFDRPLAMTRLADDSLVIADSGTSRLRRICDRKVSTIGVRGLNQPEALLPLGHGVLVADTSNHRLVLVDVEARTVRPVAINGLLPSIDPSLQLPSEPASSITVPWPVVGTGPWTIEVTGEPTELVDEGLSFERSDPTEPISVPLTSFEAGSILVVATGADPVSAASYRIDVSAASTDHRIQRPVMDEPADGRLKALRKKRRSKEAEKNSMAGTKPKSAA